MENPYRIVGWGFLFRDVPCSRQGDGNHVNHDTCRNINDVVLFAGQGADNNKDAPRSIEPALLFILTVMDGQAAVGRVQTGKAVVRGIKPYPELIEEIGHSALIVKSLPRISNWVKEEKTKANK